MYLWIGKYVLMIRNQINNNQNISVNTEVNLAKVCVWEIFIKFYSYMLYRHQKKNMKT